MQLDLKNRFLANPGLTTVGASALWAAFLSFLITSIYLVVLRYRVPRLYGALVQRMIPCRTRMHGPN